MNPDTANDQLQMETVSDQPQVEMVKVRVTPDGRLTRRDAAKYLGLQPKTLAMWAIQGRGPPFLKIGNRAFYYRDALDRVIAGQATT